MRDTQGDVFDLLDECQRELDAYPPDWQEYLIPAREHLATVRALMNDGRKGALAAAVYYAFGLGQRFSLIRAQKAVEQRTVILTESSQVLRQVEDTVRYGSQVRAKAQKGHDESKRAFAAKRPPDEKVWAKVVEIRDGGVGITKAYDAAAAYFRKAGWPKLAAHQVKGAYKRVEQAEGKTKQR